ncbi:MAG: TetR/AcrR family transcriptional regulator [Mycobacteriales bacterium]
MSRSRAGILSGASASILKFGTRKTTMGDIARVGGVAKATLYNHFRDKRELYAALVDAEVDALIVRVAAAYTSGVSSDPVTNALTAAALGVAGHPLLRHIAGHEPVVLGSVICFGDRPAWLKARRQAAGLFGSTEPSAAGDLALRWVVSHAGWPAVEADVAAAAAVVAAAGRVLAAPPDEPVDQFAARL